VFPGCRDQLSKVLAQGLLVGRDDMFTRLERTFHISRCWFLSPEHLDNDLNRRIRQDRLDRRRRRPLAKASLDNTFTVPREPPAHV